MNFWRRSSVRPTEEELACDLIRKSDLFDAAWYLEKYPDVRQANFDPALHYTRHGAQEGRKPGPWFDVTRYLELVEDGAGINNPLLHYLQNRDTLILKDEHQERSYSNLGEFLKFSLLSPLTLAPFKEEDRRCFAVMESIAKYLIQSLKGDQTAKVSVIMPVRNRAQTLKAAIDSVIAQTYQNFELIIVNDASEDESALLVESAAATDARIRLINLEQPVGVCAARNTGLADAEGVLIAYLDSDNTWLEDYLGAAVGAFHLLPEADAIYGGQYIYADSDVNKLSAVRFGPMNSSLLEQHNYIDLNCFLHRRHVTDSGIRFDESLQRLVDWDFILQINSNYRIVSVPILLSRYYYHAAENTITKTIPIESAAENIELKKSARMQVAAGLALKKSVCVVIPSYQALPFLRDCVASLAPLLTQESFNLVIVDNDSDHHIKSYLREIEGKNIKIILNDVNFGFSYAVNQGVAAAPPDADIVLMNNDSRVEADSIQRLQDLAYESSDIAITVPRQVLPSGAADLNLHVPYANSNLPCDVSLSIHHKNIDSLNIFHDGQRVELNFAPFFCVYIKRAIWDVCGGLDYENGRHYRSDRIMCDFVKQVLKMRIVYTPQAIVHHAAQIATKELSNIGGDVDEHKTMLVKNIWPVELMAELKIGKRPWAPD